MKTNRILLALLLVVSIAGCKSLRKQKRIVYRDSTITNITSFNNLFFDSVQLDSFLKKHAEFKNYAELFSNFYKERNYQYAWFDSKGIAEQSVNFINLLNSSITELQDSSLYNPKLFELYEAAVTDTLHLQKQTDVFKTELLLTGQFFSYATKIYKGSDLDATDLGWFIPRKKIDLRAILDTTIKSKVTDAAMFAAQNTQYIKLQEQLDFYYKLAKNTNKDIIPKQKKALKTGDSSAVIIQVKRQLALLGDLKTTDNQPFFDTLLFEAVKHFQTRMGLTVDGTVGNKMIEELNIPPQQRIRQLLVNMERLRWMPPIKDSNFILVNIPEYRLHVFDSGRSVLDMNIIVGKAANSTVIFNASLKFIVFSPYWNIPPSIVRKEILPAMSRNSNYLRSHNMEITGTLNGLPVIRQKPGETNSLGLVKFLFPNNYNIYLHDTPNRELFSLSSRSLSHGCIRISEPKKMAQFLLRDDPSWDSDMIDSAMHLSKEKWVTLKKTVPVFIVYFTAWVDKTGTLNLRKDIYGHDEKMAAKLFTK